MSNEKTNKVLVFLVFLLSVGTYYYNDTPIQLGAYILPLNNLLSALIVCLGLVCILVHPDLNRLKTICKDGLVLLLPYLILLFFSMMIWVYRLSPLREITRGASAVVFQSIGLCVAIVYVILFKSKAIVIQMFAMVTAEFILFYTEIISKVGIAGFVREYIDLVTSFGEVKSDGFGQIEGNEVCFAFGIYLIYYLVKKGKVKHRFSFAVLSAFCLCAGFKRIVVIGAAVSFSLTFLLGMLPEKIRIRILSILKYVFIIGLIAYIAVVKFGIFNALAELWNIDTKGRTGLNDFIDSYYTFSPLFVGYGLGYIARLLESVTSLGGAVAVHNDYLRLFIEAGFWGYLVWLWCFWGYRTSYFTKNRNKQVYLVFFALSLYCATTYLTDNTCFYLYTNISFFTLILSCSSDEIEKNVMYKLQSGKAYIENRKGFRQNRGDIS